MENFPLVSAVMVAEEDSAYIPATLDSILAQSYGNLDLVFLDGSEDGAVSERVEAWQAGNGRNVRRIARPGMSVPEILLKAWREAAGSAAYVQWILPGDILAPNKIDYMMKVYLQYPHKNIAMVASHLQGIDANGKPDPSVRGDLSCEAPRLSNGREICLEMLMGEEDFIGDLSNPLINVAFLRNAMELFPAERGVSERIFWMALLLQGNLAYIPEPLTYVRPKGVTLQGVMGEIAQWASMIRMSRDRNDVFSESYEMRQAITAWLEQASRFCRMAMEKNTHTDEVTVLQKGMEEFASLLARASAKKLCACCGHELEYYLPLPRRYDEMYQKYGGTWGRREMENRHEMVCPRCGSSDRYRAYAIWIKRELGHERKQVRFLEFAPEPCMTHFIRRNFPWMDYKTSDLVRTDVDYQMDVMDMRPIATGSIDFFLCSHVLEHVRDDRRAMRELYRILAPGGRGICVVPIDLDQEETDEDPDCTDVGEQWRRFGMESHLRKYSREDYIKRLQQAGFHVEQYQKDWFGLETMRENGLEDTATVYVVSKPL